MHGVSGGHLGPLSLWLADARVRCSGARLLLWDPHQPTCRVAPVRSSFAGQQDILPQQSGDIARGSHSRAIEEAAYDAGCQGQLQAACQAEGDARKGCYHTADQDDRLHKQAAVSCACA